MTRAKSGKRRSKVVSLEAFLQNAAAANMEHFAILKQGAEVWDDWRKRYPEIRHKLAWTDLSRARLQKADLRGVDLGGAKFHTRRSRHRCQQAE
jgi:uncharacterized protein YjbI with pentapeptide repeats